MKPYGLFKKKILVVGEAPGETEDRVSKQFQGKAGKVLQNMMRKLGINLFEDCMCTNAVNCRPVDKQGKNRAPTNYEIDCCRRSLLFLINREKPKVIILLGKSSVYSLIGYRWKRELGEMTKWRGWTIPDQDLKCWICPTFHPSYIEREKDPVVKIIWKNDLSEAINKLYQPFRLFEEPKIEVIRDLNILNHLNSGIQVVIDFETTGIKPHNPIHKIVAVGIADSENHAYVSLLPESRRDRLPLLRILSDQNIPKIGQNIKYEHNWSIEVLRVEIKGWIWDTMIVSHILDNRTGITGLKFQSYVQFGIADYYSEVDSYLRATDGKSTNSVNKIFDLLKRPSGEYILLNYLGYDCICTYRLKRLQESIIEISDLPF